jgi:hypothetical protein
MTTTATARPSALALAALSVAASAALATAPAFAQDAGPRTNLIYGDTELVLEFLPNCSPGLQCPFFALTCSLNMVTLFVLDLDVGHIERWAQGNEPAQLVVGDVPGEFTPDRMLEDENGNWFVQLEPAGHPADVLWEVLGGGDEVLLMTPFYTFAVEPTDTDRGNMVAFATGCLGAAARN